MSLFSKPRRLFKCVYYVDFLRGTLRPQYLHKLGNYPRWQFNDGVQYVKCIYIHICVLFLFLFNQDTRRLIRNIEKKLINCQLAVFNETCLNICKYIYVYIVFYCRVRVCACWHWTPCIYIYIYIKTWKISHKHKW